MNESLVGRFNWQTPAFSVTEDQHCGITGSGLLMVALKAKLCSEWCSEGEAAYTQRGWSITMVVVIDKEVEKPAEGKTATC